MGVVNQQTSLEGTSESGKIPDLTSSELVPVVPFTNQLKIGTVSTNHNLAGSLEIQFPPGKKNSLVNQHSDLELTCIVDLYAY